METNKTALRRSILIDFLQEKTPFVYGVDFRFQDVLNRTKERPDPKDWVILTVLAKTRQITKDEKRETLIKAVEQIPVRISYGKKFTYVQLPEHNNTSLISVLPANSRNNVKQSESFDSYKKNLAILSEVHAKLSILGTKNKDQPDLAKGFGYFNYFDQIETNKALQIFTDLDIALEPRKEKGCNLTFLLDFDSEKLDSLEKKEWSPSRNTLEVCLWLIKKIYRKTILNLPHDTKFGASEVCRVQCGEIDFFRIKKELEKNYNIILVIKGSGARFSEFFVLTSEEAKNLYQTHKDKLSPCDLFKLLMSPETTIEKISSNSKLEAMQKEQTQTLSQFVMEELRSHGLKFTSDSEDRKKLIYLQLRMKKDSDQLKIEVIHGSPADKTTIIQSIVPILEKQNALIQKNTTGTAITVSIPGLKNSPPRKRRKTPAALVENTSEAVITTQAAENTPLVVYNEEELELRKILNDPILSSTLSVETKKIAEEYFRKKETEMRAIELLKKLGAI